MSYGAILQQGREKSDLSRREVARQAGISEGHLRFLEKGERETTPETLRRLAIVLGIDEKPLMEAWIKKHMPAMDFADLAARLPKGINIEQLKEIYQIEHAKEIYSKFADITASRAKDLEIKDIIQLKTALDNCLRFIRELEGTENVGRL
jgi:transcriptional regulator with XRE-family HTH domain